MRKRRPTDRVLRRTAAWLGAVSLAALPAATTLYGPTSAAWAQPPAWQSQSPATPSQPPTIALNLKRFEIPFSIDRNAHQPAEVQLLVSRDQGGRWDLFAAQPVSGKNFQFLTDQDGLYWFATRTVDVNGKTDSVDSLRPQLIVNVDTTNPTVELDAWFDEQGYVQFKTSCNDRSPALDAIQVLYGVEQSRQWVAVSELSGHLDPTAADRYYSVGQFQPPEQAQQVTVRVTVSDAAGNVTTVSTQVNRPRIAANDFRLAGTKAPWQTQVATATDPYQGSLPPPQLGPQSLSQPLTGQPAPPQSMTGQPALPQPMPGQQALPQPAAAPSPWAVPQFAVSSGLPGDLPAGNSPSIAGNPGSQAANGNAPSISGFSSGLILNGPATAGVATMSLPPAEIPSNETLPSPSGIADPARQRPQTAAGAMRPIGIDDPSQGTFGNAAAHQVGRPADAAAPYSPPATVGEPNGNSLSATGVQVRFSNSRKFSLEYEVESTGLAGVSDVELWGTRDRGLSWKRWGADPDRQSPFDIETNNDGAYGFRIVVIAGNGLATPRPAENDLPDIFVVVDTQVPDVRITGAAYGEGNHTGSLVIRYQCTDLHLTERPITLSFGPSTSGPWTTIAAGLLNEGAYLWPADPHLPRQIFLRIDGIDLAGNEGSYVLETPIDVQGLAPRARIRGFNPLTGASNLPRSTDAATSAAAQPQARFK